MLASGDLDDLLQVWNADDSHALPAIRVNVDEIEVPSAVVSECEPAALMDDSDCRGDELPDETPQPRQNLYNQNLALFKQVLRSAGEDLHLHTLISERIKELQKAVDVEIGERFGTSTSAGGLQDTPHVPKKAGTAPSSRRTKFHYEFLRKAKSSLRVRAKRNIIVDALGSQKGRKKKPKTK
jgi:hypothetical protein